jgi:hypothetical protein
MLLLKTSASAPELKQGVYENWEQIYSNNLNFRQNPLIVMHSQPTTNNARLMVFIRGTDSTFHVHEELKILCSLKCTEIGEGMNVYS